MQLDIRTLVVASALITAFCAVGRITLCRLHPATPGLDRWAAAGVVGTVGFLLVAAGGVIPVAAMLLVVQVLIAVGFALSWDGFRRFLGRRSPTRRQFALLALSLVVPATTFCLGVPDPTRRTLEALVVSLLSAAIAGELLFGKASGGAARRITGWIFVTNVVFFILRAFLNLRVGAPFEQVNGVAISPTTLLWWNCWSVAVTLGMAVMAGERLQESLKRQANRDPLTGALNRRAFALLAEREMARTARLGQPLSLLMMDLDHFKKINDHLGHANGDAILCLFVSTLRRVLRNIDVLCRFGGEEFLVLLPDTPGIGAQWVAERLRTAYAREAAADPVVSEGHLPFPLTVSIGIAEMQAGEDLAQAIARADAALYQAKALGRDRTEIADGFAETETGTVQG